MSTIEDSELQEEENQAPNVPCPYAFVVILVQFQNHVRMH
jgi:hypothetical protein